jgi:hypothetical protein
MLDRTADLITIDLPYNKQITNYVWRVVYYEDGEVVKAQVYDTHQRAHYEMETWTRS